MLKTVVSLILVSLALGCPRSGKVTIANPPAATLNVGSFQPPSASPQWASAMLELKLDAIEAKNEATSFENNNKDMLVSVAPNRYSINLTLKDKDGNIVYSTCESSKQIAHDIRFGEVFISVELCGKSSQSPVGVTIKVADTGNVGGDEGGGGGQGGGEGNTASNLDGEWHHCYTTSSFLGKPHKSFEEVIKHDSAKSEVTTMLYGYEDSKCSTGRKAIGTGEKGTLMISPGASDSFAISHVFKNISYKYRSKMILDTLIITEVCHTRAGTESPICWEAVLPFTQR